MTVTNRRFHRAQLPTPSHFHHNTVGPAGVSSVAGSSFGAHHHHHQQDGGSASNSNGREGSTAEQDGSYLYTPFPKHVPFPNIEQQSEFVNELIVFCFTIVASVTQFLHLYRSVWWLPNSYNRQAVNFYLIDWDLAIFIDIMASRRLIYCGITKFVDANCPEVYLEPCRKGTKYAFLVSMFALLLACGAQIYQKAGYVHLFVLCYPLVLYPMFFGFNVEHFLRTIVDTQPNCINGMPLHSCSSKAVSIRAEIDTLKADFFNRCRQVFFTSLLNAYYAGFVPCMLASKHLYYNNFWTIQHMAGIFIGGFTMSVTYCFPVRYFDVFYRASLHLGVWNRVNARGNNLPAHHWSAEHFYPYGTYVRHNDELYRSTSSCTAAIPKNNSHLRFYGFFSNPRAIFVSLIALQLCMVLFQLLLLSLTREWQNALSLGFMLLANYFTLFRLVRDYLILRRIYANESLSHPKYKTN
ncbi:transmembrane protein 39A-B [Anopheles darlingi]|uniref:transmembrane protein 39A-B n=1 Tax=Anopheles darlingi TaxID=43151 RepID=UPI0021000CEA|nr:transmembrane protein 39A-B [Anopheles darlingi]